MKTLLVLAMLLFVVPEAQAQELEKYRPLAMSFCDDVQLRCAVMVSIETPMYFAVFSEEGTLIAITKVLDGVETTVWGRLPLKKNEKGA